MQLTHTPTAHFKLVPPKPITYTHVVYWIYKYTHYKYDFITSTMVNWSDTVSLNRVAKITGLLGYIYGTAITQCVTALDTQKKVIRLSQEQKYNRAVSKVHNAMQLKLKALKGNLFEAAQIAELQADYSKTLEILKTRYGI